MNRWSIFLGIGLVVQAALAVGANLARTDYSAFKPTETLLSPDVKAADGILIDQDQEQSVKLENQEGQWRVPPMFDFEADQDKVRDFLKKLSSLKKGWPVGTTAAAARHFKVAEDDYERKITLSKEGKGVDTLFIGTSPSFKKVHARRKGDDSVYAVDFSAYEAGTKPEDWIDKNVFKRQPSAIARVDLPDFSLARRDDKLTVEGLDGESEEMIPEEADRLVRKIADLRISSVLGREYHQDHPVFRYTVVLSSGESEEYVFSKMKETDAYVLKASPREEYFKVDGWIVDGIKKIDRSKILRKKNDTA